jgi:hypothetical protein
MRTHIWPAALLLAVGYRGRVVPAQDTREAKPGVTAAKRAPSTAVQTEMRHVDFHVDRSVVLRIEYLRGVLHPAKSGSVPYFDDKHSFVFNIDSADIAIDMDALTDLLNRYVFAYPGSPLRNIRVAVDGGKLRQRMTARGVAVTTVSEVSVTPAGEIRLHPTTIKAAGIPVRGFLKLFGLRLQKFVNLSGARGVRFDGDDLLLSVSELLPPPAIRGRLAAVTLRENSMVQQFAPVGTRRVEPLLASDRSSRNYMYYRGGVLRFGRLTMTGVDLLIQDADPRDPFDFFLDHYNEQLVAGYSKNTLGKGLIAVMPDYGDVATVRRRGGLRPAPRIN